MIRISLPYIFGLAAQLEPLESLPTDKPVPFGSLIVELYGAQAALTTLVESSIFAPYLRASRALSQQLLKAINDETSQSDFDRQVSQFSLWSIRNAYGQYKTALLAELGALNSYFVTAKGGFDMYTLLMSGENLFPTDLASKVPEAIVDAREAAKALCYDVPTACGFHTFRATESVLRRYYTHMTGGTPQPKVRNIGVYLNALKQANKGDPKILASLKQMTDLHRNPLIHPEVILTTDEAIATLGIAQSVITAILAVLPAQPPTTTSPQAIPALSSS
jgi:hypothetical protein